MIKLIIISAVTHRFKRLLVAPVFVLLSIVSNGQDIHFSQFSNMPLLQNPGLAGAMTPFEGSLIYRSQWRSVTIPYKTYAASINMRFNQNRNKTGFWAGGISFFGDQSGNGNLRTTIGNISTAYHVHLNKYNKLGLGVQAGFGQRQIDPGNFRWGSQYSGSAYNGDLPIGEQISNPSFMYPDVSAGLVWSFNNNSKDVFMTRNKYRKGNLGVSVFHINRPNYSFNTTGERLFMKFVAHGNFLFSIPDSRIAINPGFMYYRQGPSSEVYFGAMIRRSLIERSKYTDNFKGSGASAGLYLRSNDALVFSTLFELAHYSIGMTYDLNVSKLSRSSGGRGGFELSFKYTGISGGNKGPAKF